MRYFIIILFFFFNSMTQLTGQEDNILSWKEFMGQVATHHPLAEQNRLQLRKADAERLSAKGFLDPQLSSYLNQKDFKDKLYYREWGADISVPTPLGIDVVGGYMNTDGVFLNPEDQTDRLGLWNLGVEINAIQGFWVNERRLAKDKAEVFGKMAESKLAVGMNELLFAASLAYWDWVKYNAFQSVLENNEKNAEAYLDYTKNTFFNGEKTAVDTLEAYIMLQDARNLSQKNKLYQLKTAQLVQGYMWEDGMPMLIASNVAPETIDAADMIGNPFNVTDDIVQNHPMILEKIQKREFTTINQRLKREKLKPKLKIKYHPLFATSDNIIPSYNVRDFKWGFDFSMPILFRRERADVEKGEIKLKEIQLDIDNKSNELKNKLIATTNQREILLEQLLILEENVVRYQRLLEAENEKFNYGESSVFLLNKRQEKYLNGQLKLIDLKIKIQLNQIEYLFLSNNLWK